MSDSAVTSATLLAFAEQLADAARAVTLASFRRPLDIVKKEDDSPVTAVDRGAEQAMRELIKRHRPADDVFGEEFGRSDSGDSGGDVWVLDPIDGTKSFISGSPLYCTLVAFVRDGAPLLGVLDMPALGERWCGLDMAGAQRATFNGAECAVSAPAAETLASAVMATTTLNFWDDEADTKLRRLCRLTAHTRLGGDAFCYGCLASGYVDVVADYAMRPYDYLPLVPLVTAAGGVISDWQGAPLTLPKTGSDGIGVVAAASPELHKQALAALNSVS